MSVIGRSSADLARLPIDAALDLFAVSAGASRALEPSLQADVAALLERIAAEPSERRPALLGRVVSGLAARTDRGGLPAPTLEAVGRALLREPLPSELVQSWLPWIWAGSEQLAVILLGALLDQARRDDVALRDVLAAVLPLARADSAAWREHAAWPIRDQLVSTLIELAVLRGWAEAAADLGVAWPPGRTALVSLAVALATGRDLGRLRLLLERYTPFGGLLAAVLAALWTDAGRRQDDSLAAWLALWAPGPDVIARVRAATAPPLWPLRRRALLEALVAADNGPWLVDALLAEPDAAAALDALMRTPGARPRDLARCADALRQADPEQSFARAASRLRDLLRAGGATLDRAEVRRLRAELAASAAAMGEPSLADGVLAVLRRELGETAVPR